MVNESENMADQQRLQDKLAKLGSEEIGTKARGRALQTASGSNLLQAVLSEIDETILGRLLRFENDKGAILQIEVASRRLLRLIALSEFKNASQYSTLLNQSILEDDEAQKRDIATLLRDFAAHAKTVFVQSEKLSRDVEADEIGIFADAMAKACGIFLYDKRKTSKLLAPKKFLANCQDSALAWVRIDGSDALEEHGDTANVELLTGLLNTDLPILNKRLDRCLNKEIQNYCVVFNGDTSPDKSMMYLRQKKGDWFFLFNGDDATQAVAAWHS